jgi:ankyrin repeat protein
MTALMLAAMGIQGRPDFHPSLAVVRLLLDAGADVTATVEGQSALDFARADGNTEIYEILEDALYKQRIAARDTSSSGAECL